MPLSPSPSSTERGAVALALIAALVGTGCSDDASCGPGSAAVDGLTMTVDGQTVRYGGFIGGRNNDCNVAGSGVVSVTIGGTQSGDSSPVTLCLPRPDLLDTAAVPLTHDRIPPADDDRAQLIDAVATLAGGCRASLDGTRPITATASFTGLCAAGADPAGFALTVTGTVPVNVVCPDSTTPSTATLAGTVAVGTL